MSKSKLLNALMDGRPVFFQEFLKYPLQIGFIIPNSRFLEHHLVEATRVFSAKTIVELGPGTGSTTRAILRAMARHANLLSIEINPNFHALLRCIEDDRLIVHLGDANGLKEIISMYGLGAPEVVISGIPFSTMSHTSGSQIIEAILTALAPRGRFVVYQVSKRIASLCQTLLGSGQVEVELLDTPPMRVYRWEMPAG